MAGIPLILVGQSGENVGRTALQVWEKVSIPLVKNDKKRGMTHDGPWLVLVILSTLFILENILVRLIRCSRGTQRLRWQQHVPVVATFTQYIAKALRENGLT